MSTHTRGPWSRSQGWWVIGADMGPVCQIDYALRDKTEADANSLLIAAAPEIFEAATRALDVLREYMRGECSGIDVYGCISDLQVTLAKAEGKP